MKEDLTTAQVREVYNTQVGEVLGGAYEEQRWDSSRVARSGFLLATEAIEDFVVPHLHGVQTYLELGPGPGTWTKVLQKHIPHAHLHLVDISRAMLDLARKNLSSVPQVTFTESDFLEFQPPQTYDVFFSSRAIEYFSDKAPVVSKVASSLRKGGKAFIITKMPHYFRMKLLGKTPGVFHQHQASPKEYIRLAGDVHLRLIDMRPVFVVVPGLRSATLNLFFTRLLRKFPWNPVTAAITESYLMVFEKV